MTVSLPDDFLWGVAAAAHQIEGGNWNNDWWAWEHAPNTACIEVSGDCCDSYHRYADDIALVRDLGFPSYRFSIEWSRIEPEDGEFSRAALDYYRRVLATCRENGVAPLVTFHHFTTPRWMADRGGWVEREVVDKFTRFCEKAVAHLGDLMAMGCTINEPNVVSMLGYLMERFPPGLRDFGLYRKAVGEPARRAPPFLRRAEGRAGRLPGRAHGLDVGLVVARGRRRGDASAPARCTRTSTSKPRAGTTSSVCRRTRASASGSTGCRSKRDPDVPMIESMGYEYWPQGSKRRSGTRSRSPAARST